MQYLPFILTALIGIGGVLFNTKQDLEKPTKYFNKPTPTGFLAILFIVAAFITATYLSHIDSVTKDIEIKNIAKEKKQDSEYKASSIKFLTQTDSAQSVAIEYAKQNQALNEQHHGDQLKLYKVESNKIGEKLRIGEQKVDELNRKNSELQENLTQQMDVSYFSMLNQTIVEPEVSIYLYTEYNFKDEYDVVKKELSDLISIKKKDISSLDYFSKSSREQILPGYTNLSWRSRPQEKSKEYVIFSFNFELSNLWKFKVDIYNNGYVSSPSSYTSDSTNSYEIMNNRHSITVKDGFIFIDHHQNTKANSAILYNSLQKSVKIFSINASFLSSIPDILINKKLN